MCYINYSLYVCHLNHVGKLLKSNTAIFWILRFLLCFPRQHGKVRDSDEENDPDDEDVIANAVGCLGPFSGLLAPELQKYQKQVKGKEEASVR